MPGRDTAYLLDILEAARLLQSFVGEVERTAFDNDPLRQAAVVRQLEIIGEAAKRISGTFRSKHDYIPWRHMSGMRDILIHAYDHVDLDEVWNVAVDDIPKLVIDLEAIMASDAETQG